MRHAFLSRRPSRPDPVGSGPVRVRWIVFALVALPMLASTAGATIVVDGACTLGDAIRAANADSAVGACTISGGDDTIVLDVDVVLTAADTTHSTFQSATFAGLPDVTTAVRIQAGDATRIARDPALDCTSNTANHFRIVHVVGGELTLVGLELENGCARRRGGGVLVVAGAGGEPATLSLTDATLRENAVEGSFPAAGLPVEGGAVYVGPGASLGLVERSTFTSNSVRGGFGSASAGDTARGGAIYLDVAELPDDLAGGLSEIVDSTFVGNRVFGGESTTVGGFGFGGAIASARPLGRVVRTVFDSNEVRGGGGSDAPGESSGGAVHVDIEDGTGGAGESRLTGLVFRDNASFGGTSGALDGEGAAGIASSAYLSGRAEAPIVLEGSRITGGTTIGGGGGFRGGDGRCSLFALTATTVRQTTVDRNLVRGGSALLDFGGSSFGGGACGDDDSVFEAVTLSQNRVEGGPSLEGVGGFAGGGGFSTFGTSDSELVGLTITDNEAVAGPGASLGESRAGGIYTAWFVTFRNTIAAGNRIVTAAGVAQPNDCSINQFGNSAGYNLVQVPGDCADDLTLPGDRTGLDPALESFDDYGCAIELADGRCAPTHALPLASPAIDTGSCGAGSTEDGRGFSRPVDVAGVADADDGCDVGAYEARDLDGDGVEDGIALVNLFADGFESGDASAWSVVVP